jgi:sialate O-acetylesterase
VGKRLALIALKRVYGQAVQDSGPAPSEIKRDGTAWRIRFENAEGLHFRGDASHLFAVADASRKFVPAKARIEGDTVIVSAKEVQNPVAVRFGWTNNPQGFLVDREGLPAGPFRSDDWPGTEQLAR